MESTVAALMAGGKGLLAADESFPTLKKRFDALQIESTEASRRSYRELLFSTPGLGEFISGVILFDETMRQKVTTGLSMPLELARQGILPGIKVDGGAVPLAHFAGEKLTEGLDGLRARLVEYRALGARFTKWRAVLATDGHLPSRTCLEANAEALALFAALSQEAGLVPIVEPEVLLGDGQTLARCEEVTATVLECVFAALFRHRVVLEQLLLKTGMVLPGRELPEQAEVEVIAEATARCLRRRVPAAVGGIVFLSGGQGDEIATQRLEAICRRGAQPWPISFSFGRALQAAALRVWSGREENVAAAQEALNYRARSNSAALLGKYSTEREEEWPPERAGGPAPASGLTIARGYRAQAADGSPFPQQTRGTPE